MLVIQSRNKSSSFQQISKKLTFFNLKILIIFIILFYLTVGTVLAFYIYLDQQGDILSVLKQEVKEVKENSLFFTSDSEKSHYKGKHNKVYCSYFITKNGVFEIGEEIAPGYTNEIRKTLIDLNPDQNKVSIRRVSPHHKEELYLIIATEKVYDSSHHFIGTAYIGKDLSFVIYLIKQFFIISFLLTVIFCFMAFYFGKKMTNQAMDPIIASYTEQQEFVENASHELRTPLSVFQAGIEVLSLEKNKLSDFGQETLSDLKKELDDTRNLVQHLLFLARFENQKPSKERVDEIQLDVFSEQIQKAWQYKLSEKNQFIKLKTTEKIKINTNQESLKQLLNIFIDNAIKYSKSGSIITLNYYLQTEKKTTYLYYQVIDNGIGIAPEFREKIFNRFYRIEEHRSREEGNTGLGLSIAKSIIEILNGEIYVESEFGKGSIFTIKIPSK